MSTQKEAATSDATKQPEEGVDDQKKEFIDMKTKFLAIKYAVDHREEPLDMMKSLSEFIEKVVQDPTILDADPEFKQFFYQELVLGMLKRMHKERSANPDYLATIAELMRQFVRLFAKEIDNADLAEAMRFAFDYNCILHTYHYEDAESEIRIIEQKKQEQWRHDLKLNDEVDAIAGDEKCKTWCVATITAVHGEILELQFENCIKAYDKALSRFSPDIAQLGEYSKENEWKADLKVGDEVDAFDKAKVWYASTVLDFKQFNDPSCNREYTLAKIGFRIYSENGAKKDEEEKKFDGWSSRFDEWLPVWSPKVSKLHSHTKPKGGKGSRFYEETVIDDASDPQVKEGEEPIFAVIRPRKSKSYLLIECMNLFGREGGYDRMIEKMSDKKNPIDFTILSFYMDCLGKVFPMYHRDFISHFAIDIQKCVQNCILNAPEASIRNVRKEKIDGIVNRLSELLRRVMPFNEREVIIEQLKLDIALMCLKSNFLERRIQGIKNLSETLKDLNHSMMNRVSSEQMLEWLDSNKILEIIFDPKNYHVQIIQRSKEVLRFLLVEDRLTEYELNLFWRATEFDDETRREMYKIIHDNCTPMNENQTIQFLNKFKEDTKAKIIPEAVNCIYEMGKYTDGSKDYSKTIAEVLFRVAVDTSNPVDVSDLAISKLSDLFKRWKYIYAKPYFYASIENLKKHKSSIESIKILKSLFKDIEYTIYSSKINSDLIESDEEQSKATDIEEDNKDVTEEDRRIIGCVSCIMHFIESEDLINIFIDDFINYSKSTQGKIGQVKDISKIQEHIFDGRYDHKTNITQRLDFLKFLATFSTYTISRKEVDRIWNALIDESKIDYDEGAVFKWLRESCETEIGSAKVWELKDIGEIFNERLGKGSNDMGSLTLDGFYCIQSYFLLANETSEKLRRFKKTVQKTNTAVSSYSNTTGAQFSTFSWNRQRSKQVYETTEESTFNINVEPKELDGIANIWKIIIDSQNSDVKEKAIAFLIQLYQNLSPVIEDKRRDIHYDCIHSALKYLDEIQSDTERAEDVKSVRITSIVKVLDEFIAQSERKGTTGLKQQRSLLKGELLDNISVTNSVSYNKLIGRRIELSLFSNNTVYDIKRIIGAINKVPAEYVRLIRVSNSSEIKDTENGKTLADLGFKANEKLIANKQSLGNIPKAPLLNPDKTLTPEAEKIFGEWFDSFSHDGLMTPEDCVEFIRSCTDDKCKTSDGRVKNLFNNHDYDNDGKVDKAGFVEFYKEACIRKEEVVRSNILAHNYRNDLQKISDTCEENTDKTVLPRYILSHNSEYFECLFRLLDRPDESSKEAWNLIQKLVTNPTIEDKILNLNVEKNENGEYNWDSLIDTKSIFKLLYMFQIIESLIEEGGDEFQEICKVYKNKETTTKEAPTVTQPRQGGPALSAEAQEEEKQKEKEAKKQAELDNMPTVHLVSDLLASNAMIEDIEQWKTNEEKLKELRKTWIFRFLDMKGFEFSYDLFSKNTKDIRTMNAFEKNFLGFLLKILRIFITAAFLAVEPEVANVVSLMKKQSLTNKPEEQAKEDSFEVVHDDDDENIYSTPKNKKSRSRTEFQVVDLTTGHPLVTEEYLFSGYDDLDSDKASASVEEVKMNKKESTVSKQSQRAAVVEKKIEQLASNLKGELGNDLLSVIDFSKLQNIILLSIASLIDKHDMDFDERKIVENSLSLWLGCSLHNPKILDDFFTFKCNEFVDVQDFMHRGILYPSIFKIREEFFYTLYCFATKITGTSINTFEYTLKCMLNKLPKDNDGEESCTGQYFELVSKLIEEYFARLKENKVSNTILDAPRFFADVIERIKAHQSREVRNSPKQDETLIGYLKIAHMVLDSAGLGECVSIAIERDFISELFQKCLFPNNMSAGEQDVTEGTDLAESLLVGNKCKTDESRKWAYKLLWTLCNNSPKLLNEVIEKQMFPLTQQIKLYPGWNYIPSGESKSCKYVGIRNLGCICYMNSMLQQLYHVPAFRYQLLQVNDGAEPDWQEYKGRTIDDNVLHQLQRMFGHLELSERVDYNPFEFCFSYKDMDGAPTNTSVQHDTEEFCNIIFDRIENMMKPTPQKYLLQSTFGGQNCSQMVCQECGFIRNRFEDFYNVSLTVKERKSVEESIKKNLEGEVISDYECPGCKKKVDITKRTLFSKTPNVLLIQLQRLIFDFDTFANQKVNTYFEFPETLDLNEYSLNHIMKKEGKLSDKDLGKKKGDASPGKEESESDEEGENDEFEGLTEEEKQEKIEERETYLKHIRYNETECYEYKLVGVIIHVGTADAGHYYSYINTDRFQKHNEQDPEWLDPSKDKWMEFNDSHVRDYNFEDLKSDCFGGSQGNDDMFGGFFKSSSYGKSAYLLVYEKRFKAPIKVLVTEEEKASSEGLECEDTAKSRSRQVIPANAVIKTDPKNNERYYELSMKDVGLFVPSKIYKDIWEDNLDFSFEKLIYSKEFYEFVKELMLGALQLTEKKESLPEDEQRVVANVNTNMCKIGNKLVLEVLAKAFYNYKMAEVTDILIKLYIASDEAVLSLMKQILEESETEELIYVFKILLNCSDKLSRASTAKLLSAVVNRCFEIEKDYLDETETVQIPVIVTSKVEETSKEDSEVQYREVTRPKSLAMRFWALTMRALKEKAPANWNKFEHFLGMINNIVRGEEQTIAMIKRGDMITFVDFMLGQNSPNAQAKGERRTKMGSAYASPNFSPLLEAVSYMVLKCSTPAMRNNSEQEDNTPEYLQLDEADIETYFLHEDFLKIAIVNSSEVLGKALAHLSYKNLEVSEAIGRVILKTINTSDYEKIKQCMTVCKPYMYIEDEFQRNRVEWILGFSCLCTLGSEQDSLPRFGVSILGQITDEAYNYMSPLDTTKNNDALLALLWRYRGRMDFYVINCLNILLEIIVENQFLLEYMFNLDPPTYEYARFTDWFRPYLEKELLKARKNISYRHSTKKEEQIVKCFSFLELYESKLRDYERKLQGISVENAETEDPNEATKETTQSVNQEALTKRVGFADEETPEFSKETEPEEENKELPVIDHYPKNYIVGSTTKIEEISREEKEGITMIVQKIYVEYAESQPTLEDNKTLPSYAFYTAKTDSEEYNKAYQRSLPRLEDENAEFASDAAEFASGDQEFDRDESAEYQDVNPARKDTPNITVSRVGEERIDSKGAVSQVKVTNKNQQDDDPDESTSDWNIPKRVGDVITVVVVQNSTSKGFDVTLKVVCDDDLAKDNIKTPVNSITAHVRPLFYDMWCCFQKVDPDKDWGQFHIEWEAVEALPETRNARGNDPMRNYYHAGGREEDEYDAYAHHMAGPVNYNMNFYNMI